MWPVKLQVVKDDEELEVDLTDKFILVVWVYYTARVQMPLRSIFYKVLYKHITIPFLGYVN